MYILSCRPFNHPACHPPIKLQSRLYSQSNKQGQTIYPGQRVVSCGLLLAAEIGRRQSQNKRDRRFLMAMTTTTTTTTTTTVDAKRDSQSPLLLRSSSAFDLWSRSITFDGYIGITIDADRYIHIKEKLKRALRPELVFLFPYLSLLLVFLFPSFFFCFHLPSLSVCSVRLCTGSIKELFSLSLSFPSSDFYL